MRPNDLESVLAETREVARAVVAPNAEACDREARWPAESISALQAAGLGGLVVPREYGGLGLGLTALAQVCEILGQECASTAICYGMHCVASAVIAAHVTPSQRDRFLTPIVEGRHVTALALSEPGTGSHFYLPQTRLGERDDELVLNGVKTFVTNGGHADSYVVSASMATPEPSFSCVILANDSPGLHWGPPWNGLGLRGNASRALELADARCPRDHMLGSVGDQIWYVFNIVSPYFLVAMAGIYAGVAGAALGDLRRHLDERHHSHNGLTLSQIPVLQHRLGTLWCRLERTRCLMRHAAASFDDGDPDALVAVMAAKAEVAGCATHLADEAITLCGGIAYRGESRLHRLSRDARAAHLMSPTTDMLRVWIGRALLGQPLLAE